MRPLLPLLLPLLLTAQSQLPAPLPLQPFDTIGWTEALPALHPRLVLTPDRLRRVRERIASDPDYAGYYRGIRADARDLLDEPLLDRELEGRRLLGVSREALRRTTTLALVFLVEEDDRYLTRLEEEVAQLTAFKDWNPSHFLDVAEMALAVSLAVDWCGDRFSTGTREAALTALHDHALQPALDKGHWWVDSEHNWNQVCHGGTVAAALVLAERHPEMAGRAIHRALEKIPLALRSYAPDGAYPEGPGYWAYGTAYSVVTSELLRTALGSDYGLAEYPGFLGSATFNLVSHSPSGLRFNYGDNSANSAAGAAELMAWFALRDQTPSLYRPDALRTVYAGTEKRSRLAPLALIWIAEYAGPSGGRPPLVWTGQGINPVFTLRDAVDPSFFLAGKGGRGSINHGNLDAGSFVFDLDGVRWAHDLGSQPYNALEQIGFQLWGKDQNAQRWTLISKNNYNHNTLTVNDSLHRVDGFAALHKIDERTFAVDMAPVFGDFLDGARRTFTKTGPRSFTVTDSLALAEQTERVSWRMLTRAEVELTDNGAILRQDGKRLRMTIVQPSGLRFSVVQLDPPPLPYDMQVPGLKRLQLDVPAYYPGEDPVIEVRFSGGE
jgi:hypothetical protein